MLQASPIEDLTITSKARNALNDGAIKKITIGAVLQLAVEVETKATFGPIIIGSGASCPPQSAAVAGAPVVLSAAVIQVILGLCGIGI